MNIYRVKDLIKELKTYDPDLVVAVPARTSQKDEADPVTIVAHCKTKARFSGTEVECVYLNPGLHDLDNSIR